jgi:hypothetical protein
LLIRAVRVLERLNALADFEPDDYHRAIRENVVVVPHSMGAWTYWVLLFFAIVCIGLLIITR